MKIINKIYKRIRLYLMSLFRSPIFFMEVLYSSILQKREFRKQNHENDALIIFFIPGIQRVTGGVLQIFTLNRLTKNYFDGRKITSLLCWLPRQGKGQIRFKGFINDEMIFSTERILDKCNSNSKLLFHVPEYAARTFFDYFGVERLKSLRAKHDLKINILNQNIEVMIDAIYIQRLKSIFPDMTCTAGNPGWASTSEKQRLNIPIYPLPTWYYPDDAPWQPYEDKKNLLIISPDKNSNRDQVIDCIVQALPELQIKVIQNLKYEKYLNYERSAKWSLTFGEGLDGYFYGPTFRGGVAFAVRNDTFDHPGLTSLKTVYDSYETMAMRIVDDIKELDNKESYEEYNKVVRTPLMNVFDKEKTATALSLFYDEVYS